MAHAAGRDAPILTVSVAAELAGMHPQTVRQYDRLGLVPAKRTRGGGRRYSLSDVDKLLEIQELSQKEGINLAGSPEFLRCNRKMSSCASRIRGCASVRRNYRSMWSSASCLTSEFSRLVWMATSLCSNVRRSCANTGSGCALRLLSRRPLLQPSKPLPDRPRRSMQGMWRPRATITRAVPNTLP